MRAKLPGDLIAVATLHLVAGGVALADMALRLSRDSFQLDLGVLGIPICFGLLLRRRGWRTLALLFLWRWLLLLPLGFLMVIAGPDSVAWNLLGVDRLPRAMSAVLLALWFVLSLWQYRVLVRPGVRRLFLVPDAELRLQLLEPADGGRRDPVCTGYRPLLQVRSDRVVRGVIMLADGSWLHPGQQGSAFVTFDRNENRRAIVSVGQSLNVFEGDELVGHATVVDVRG